TRHVDVHQLAPGVLTDLVGGFTEGEDARVGHHDVQPAELVHARVHRCGQRLDVPHVGLGGVDPAAGLLDQSYRLREVVRRGQVVETLDAADGRADVHGDDRRAVPGEPQRVAAPLPPRGSGDQCDLSV